MSSICGFFNFNDEPISNEIGDAMMEKLAIYHTGFSDLFYEKSFFLVVGFK